MKKTTVTLAIINASVVFLLKYAALRQFIFS